MNKSASKTPCCKSRNLVSPHKARREFEGLAALLNADLIVHLVAYTDESGTHDPTGAAPGSREATISGIVAPREEWGQFCQQWLTVLNKYRVPFFHFWEWNVASQVARKKMSPNSGFQKNPFRHLDAKQLNDLVVELATVAGGGNKVVVGTFGLINRFHQRKIKGTVPIGVNPYEYGVNMFFETFMSDLSLIRAPWKRLPVSFVFDQTDDVGWQSAILGAFNTYKKQHRNFTTIEFSDKKTIKGLPLQAADMVAYRTRQICGKWADQADSNSWPEVDNALLKSVFDYCRLHDKTLLPLFLLGAFEPPKFE